MYRCVSRSSRFRQQGTLCPPDIWTCEFETCIFRPVSLKICGLWILDISYSFLPIKKNGRMYGTIEELTTQYVKQYTIMFYRLKIFASDTMIAKKMIIFALRLRLLVLALFHLAPHFNLSLRCRSCKRLLVNRYL